MSHRIAVLPFALTAALMAAGCERSEQQAAVAPGSAVPEQAPATQGAAPIAAEVIGGSGPGDWRALDPENTLYMEIEAGRVVIELAPDFAPRHVANIRTLARAGYWHGLAILRSQDNYVVQWGDPHGEEEGQRKSLGDAEPRLPAELTRAAEGLPFTPLADRDGYAPEAGWSGGFPAARDPRSDEAWLAHCYGMVGAGRDVAPDSSTGAELYAVIGHAPRHLDRNITLVGRVVDGMERLSVLPRGTGDLGFYESDEQRVPIRSVRLAADVPEAERVLLELFRTGTPAFERLVEARRNRREEWFHEPLGHIDVCNVPIPTRLRPAASEASSADSAE
ncbi:MAG: peptidylprolyl isomerase [Thermoanaerobaculia bacterium]